MEQNSVELSEQVFGHYCASGAWGSSSSEPHQLHRIGMSTEPSPETRLALLIEQVRRMEVHLEAQDGLIEEMQHERNRALKWGITTLGAALMGLVMWIANIAKDHIK